MDKIKTIREKQNMTQTELAQKIGVTQKDISRWENGVREPKIEALKKIAAALNCKIDDLI